MDMTIMIGGYCLIAIFILVGFMISGKIKNHKVLNFTKFPEKVVPILKGVDRGLSALTTPMNAVDPTCPLEDHQYKVAITDFVNDVEKLLMKHKGVDGFYITVAAIGSDKVSIGYGHHIHAKQEPPLSTIINLGLIKQSYVLTQSLMKDDGIVGNTLNTLLSLDSKTQIPDKKVH